MHDATHAVGVVQDIIGEPANRNRLARYVEPTLTVGSAIAAEPINILAGLLQSGESGQDLLELFGFEPYEESPRPSQSLRRMIEVGDKLTYSPRTPEGQAGLQSLKDAMVRVMDTLGVDEAINYLNTTIVPNLQKAFGEEAAKEIGSAILMSVPMVRKVPGIRAYHGSPHDFDEFSMEQIGTGEGVQAYGHGLYFAEAEDVAKGYRNRISEERAEFFDPSLKNDYEIGRDINNSWKLYDKESGFVDADMPAFRNEAEATEFLKSGKLTGDLGFSRTRNKTQQQLEKNGFDSYVAEDVADRVALDLLQGTSQADRRKTRNFFKNNDDIIDEDGINVIDDETRKATVQALDFVDSIKVKNKKGSMYQVDIDASPDELLDLDVPLAWQSDVVRDVLADYGYKTTRAEANEYDNALLKILFGPEEGLDVPLPKEPRNPSGADIYKELTQQGKNQIDAELDAINKQMSAIVSKTDQIEQGYRTPLPGKEAEAQALYDQYDALMSEKLNMGSLFNQSQKKASDMLLKEGVKGIRYKDGFSRGAEGGTSNYVIFDDRLISIAKKYGIAIPAAAALLSQETGENPESFYQEDNSV